MKGNQMYFTRQEVKALFDTLQEWQELLGVEGEDKYAHRLKNGLGTAWGKLAEVKKSKNLDLRKEMLN